MKIVIEMAGGHDGEAAGEFRETLAPDWVKLALLEYSGQTSVRIIYGDKSFSEWRMRAVR